jgi:hypothetical protein
MEDQMSHHLHDLRSIRSRRVLPGLLVVALLGAAAGVGSSAFAAGGGAAPGKTAPAQSTGTGPVKTPPPGVTTPTGSGGGGAPNPIITAAIAQLVQAGTIDSAQAQAINVQICDNGGLDVQQFVDGGTLDATQAQAVQNALAHAKMSLAADKGAVAAKQRTRQEAVAQGRHP